MDLQVYYRKIREIEQGLNSASVVVVSRETPDGGRDGVRTEVPRHVAAKMIVEGGARLATPEEASAFQEQNAEAKRKAEQLAAASRVQYTIISQNELRKLRGVVQASKE